VVKKIPISCAGAFAGDQVLLPAPLQKNFSNIKKLAVRLYEIIYKEEKRQDA